MKYLIMVLFIVTSCKGNIKFRDVENIYFEMSKNKIHSIIFEPNEKIIINNIEVLDDFRKYYNITKNIKDTYSSVTIEQDVMLLVQDSFNGDYTGLLYFHKTINRSLKKISHYSITRLEITQISPKIYKVFGKY